MIKNLISKIAILIFLFGAFFSPLNLNAQSIEPGKAGEPLLIFLDNSCSGTDVATASNSLENLQSKCGDNVIIGWVDGIVGTENDKSASDLYFKIKNGSNAGKYYKIPYSVFAKACFNNDPAARLINKAGVLDTRNYYYSDRCKNTFGPDRNFNGREVKSRDDFFNLVNEVLRSEQKSELIVVSDGVENDLSAIDKANGGNNIFTTIISILIAILFLIIYFVTSIVYAIVQFLASASLFLVRFNPAAGYIIQSIQPIWGVAVNMGNLFLLGGFIYMGVSLIMGLSSSKGSQVSTFLGNIITIAILANFSLTMSGTAINLTQTAGDLFVAAVVLPTNPNAKIAFNPNFSQTSGKEATNAEAKKISETNGIFVNNIIKPFSEISIARKDTKGDIIAETISTITDFNKNTTKLLLELVFLVALVMLLLAFWGSFKIAVFRIAWLIILMISSPIALVSAFSPIPALKTKVGDAWVKKFISVAPIYPIFIVGLYFAAYIAGAFNALQPTNISLGDFVNDIFNLQGNTAQASSGPAIVSIIILLIGPVVSVAIIFELMKYLDGKFKEHAGAAGEALTRTAGWGLKKIGGVGAGGIAGIGTGIAGLANFRNKDGKRLNFKDGYKKGASWGRAIGKDVADLPGNLRTGKPFKSVAGWFKKRSGARDDYDKTITTGDTEIAMRKTAGLVGKIPVVGKAGKNLITSITDQMNPNSDFRGLSGSEIPQNASSFVENQAQKSLNKKLGIDSVYSNRGAGIKLNTLKEALKKNSKLSVKDFGAREFEEIAESATKDSGQMRIILKDSELRNFVGNGLTHLSAMGRSDLTDNLVKKHGALLYASGLKDTDVIDSRTVRTLKEDAINEALKSPEDFENANLDTQPFAQELKQAAGKSTDETNLKFTKKAGNVKIVTPTLALGAYSAMSSNDQANIDSDQANQIPNREINEILREVKELVKTTNNGSAATPQQVLEMANKVLLEKDELGNSVLKKGVFTSKAYQDELVEQLKNNDSDLITHITAVLEENKGEVDKINDGFAKAASFIVDGFAEVIQQNNHENANRVNSSATTNNVVNNSELQTPKIEFYDNGDIRGFKGVAIPNTKESRESELERLKKIK